MDVCIHNSVIDNIWNYIQFPWTYLPFQELCTNRKLCLIRLLSLKWESVLIAIIMINEKWLERAKKKVPTATCLEGTKKLLFKVQLELISCNWMPDRRVAIIIHTKLLSTAIFAVLHFYTRFLHHQHIFSL